MLSFRFLFLLILTILLISNVFVSVTIGIGEDIHISKAKARFVSSGFISFMIGVDFEITNIGKKTTSLQDNKFFS